MSWIKMLIFLILMFNFYNLLGLFIYDMFNIKINSLSKRLIMGFLTLKAIQWLIGFPSQVFHLSWNIYFYVMLLVYVCLFAYLIFRYKSLFSKVSLYDTVKDFTSNYWFIMLMTVSFSLWSMSSQLPYLLMNYDDHYYLGAMIQQIGSDSLATVNYFNGSSMIIGLSRLINTFEIDYGFWSSLFRFDVIFFARAVMVAHNYLILFLSFHAFSGCFRLIKENRFVQYTVLPFVIFMIPAGYLNMNFEIDLYDGWQLNTAVWYGGSLVRLTSLPVCFMFLKEWIDNNKIKGIFLLPIPYIAYLSMSSIFLPFAIISLAAGILYYLFHIYESHKTRKVLFECLVVVIIGVIGIKIGPKLLELIRPSLTNTYNNLGPLWQQVNHFTNKNVFFFVLTLITFLFYKNIKRTDLFKTIIIICFVAILFYSGFFSKFFYTICMYDFVVYRLITGIQMFLLLLCGILIVFILCKYIKLSRVADYTFWCLSVFGLLFFHTFNLMHLDDYKDEQYAFLQSGMSIYGYSFNRLIESPNMAPKLYADFQGYFKTLDQNKHRVIAQHLLPYENGGLYLSVSLAMLNNNVESCMSFEDVRCDNIDFGTIGKFDEFSQGLISYDEVKEYLEQYRIEYVIMSNEDMKNQLMMLGKEVVAESVSIIGEKIYLIKLI